MEEPSSYVLLRVVLAVASIPPLLFGLGATISGKYAARYAAVLSRASVRLTPELNYLLKPLGLYVMMFGVLMGYAMIFPAESSSIITWGAAVLFLRAIQRIVISRELQKLFNIPVGLNLLHCAYLFLLALTLVLLRPK
jgi:hypothetical protein